MKIEEYNQAYSIGYVEAMKMAQAVMRDYRSGKLSAPEETMARLQRYQEEVLKEMAECLKQSA